MPQIAHEEAALALGLHQALGLQLVVGGDHGVRAHALLARALAHRGQARAGGQQPRADALGKALGQLVGQGAVGGAGEHVSVARAIQFVRVWGCTVPVL